MVKNKELEECCELVGAIYTNSSSFRKNPKCKLFYVTAGMYNDADNNIEHTRLQSEKSLIELNLFDSVESKILDANAINQLYRKTKNPLEAEFIFENKVTLKDIDGVSESHYGVIPFKEFKKIIIDENDNIKNVFDDNVRDFQGAENAVNKNIAETLVNNNPYLFSVLNNGVTIVASEIKPTGNKLKISDYQIVNGCQTSSVLYENRNAPGIDSVEIPIRLIATTNEAIKSQITVSTNNQTTVKKEQLASLSEFQKNLEDYYKSIHGEGRLYYERRAKQYSADASVVKRKIITLQTQIKSFYAMFYDSPHRVTSYFGGVTSEINTTVFNKNHALSPYYLAGLAYYKMDSCFNSGVIDKKYKKVKFFILMLINKIISKHLHFNHLESTRLADRYCEPIINILNNPKECERVFILAAKIIDKSGVDVTDKQAIKGKSMTEDILKALKVECDFT